MRFYHLLIVFASLSLAFASALPMDPDLSTPEKSFDLLTGYLQNGAAEELHTVATSTGIESLAALSEYDEYATDGIQKLGRELATGELNWEAMTDDIYVLNAVVEGKTHQLEFTLEEPGWMLYHWQLKRKN